MSTSTRQLAREYDVDYYPGVLIQAVVPGSQLDGLAEPGWIIVRVNDRLVRHVDEFFLYIERLDLRTNAARITFTFLQPDGTFVNRRLETTYKR